MAVTNTGVYVQTPKITPQSFLPADTTAKKTIATAGGNGSKVSAIFGTSTETVNARTFAIFLLRGGTSYLLNTSIIAINAGFDGGAAPQNFFANWSALPVDNDGQRYLFLESGDALQAACTSTIAAGKEIDITVVFGNF
jgi:hypothetical protein